MPMADDALAAVRQLEIGMAGQKGREFGLEGLLDQPLRPPRAGFP